MAQNCDPTPLVSKEESLGTLDNRRRRPRRHEQDKAVTGIPSVVATRLPVVATAAMAPTAAPIFATFPPAFTNCTSFDLRLSEIAFSRLTASARFSAFFVR